MKNNCKENSKNDKLKKVCYKGLNKYDFEIPIYQRPYAWKPEEVETLLNDLKEYYEGNKNDEGYFLGTLVVNSLDKERKKLEVIDGQQRLTTLYLIETVFLKEENKKTDRKIKLTYEIRESDKKFLENLPDILELEKVKVRDKKGFTEEFINEIKKRDIQYHLISENILENLYDILKWINENKIDTPSKLLEKVYFVLAYIPKNTDVAKFFEVMNSRGKQLEQHQVLKARFLEIIKKDEENKIDYAKTWDFCSNMNYYLEDLIYYSQEEKKKIVNIRKNLIDFVKDGSLDNLKGEICNYFKLELENGNNKEDNQVESNQENKTNNDKYGTLKWILEEYTYDTKKESERKYLPETKEVNSIIKFSVFLLHTLRLFKLKLKELNKDECEKILNELSEDISLDDKKLLETFGNGDKNKLFFRKSINNNNISDDEIKIAKNFILFLLKMRIIFDYFIFKRSNISGKEDIKLRKLKNEDGGLGLGDTDKILINLQLLFNFTSPNYFQQEWLTPALSWLYDRLENFYDETGIVREKFYEEFISFLEEIDKFLSLERLIEKPDLKNIFENFAKGGEKYKPENINIDVEKALKEKLNKGTATEHYWFYKLEYLLWKDFYKLTNNKNDKNEGKIIWKELASNTQNYLNIPWESKNNKDKSLKTLIENYRLTRKNSIEHIQPRNTAKEKGWEEGNNCKENCQIDCFGNLALISNYLNSALLDKDFEGKRLKIQEQLKNGTIESLKMLLVYSKYDKWTPKECKKHHNEVLKILEENLNGEKQ